MASSSLLGGAGGGEREKNRWAKSKVYTRKSFNKSSKASNNSSSSNPTNAASAAAADNDDDHGVEGVGGAQQPLALSTPQEDANSSYHDLPVQPDAGPIDPPSDDEASSLQPHQREAVAKGMCNSVTFDLSSRSLNELRELRHKLTAELEGVRSISRKLESRFLQHSATSSAPVYTVAQYSASDTNTQTPTAKRSTSEAASTPFFRRHMSVLVPGGPATESETMEKEKRTPKANQLYRNSEFILAKDKLPPVESNKKAKANGGRKQSWGGSEMDYGGIPPHKLYSQAFKSCNLLLVKLMKHKFGWVFNTPVDVKALGLHDYYTIIKHPMDLGTVKSRLSNNYYKHPREFAEDVRLTFRNAMTYNPKGQDVHYMAEQLSQIFEEKWPAIETECAYVSHHQVPKKVPPPPLDMRALERSDSTVNPVPEAKTKPVPHSRTPSLKKPKAKDPQKRDMTFEEKQKLSNNLQKLPSEKLDNIVQIIKKRNSSLSQHDDEIEVDIDSVDVETLWELDRFVTNYKKSLSKNKRKIELASLARAEAAQNGQGRVQDVNQEPVVTVAATGGRTDDKYVSTSSPIGGERKGDNASQASSSSTSSSGSGSSSRDSESESSSGYGSDTHSPRT